MRSVHCSEEGGGRPNVVPRVDFVYMLDPEAALKAKLSLHTALNLKFTNTKKKAV